MFHITTDKSKEMFSTTFKHIRYMVLLSCIWCSHIRYMVFSHIQYMVLLPYVVYGLLPYSINGAAPIFGLWSSPIFGICCCSHISFDQLIQGGYCGNYHTFCFYFPNPFLVPNLAWVDLGARVKCTNPTWVVSEVKLQKTLVIGVVLPSQNPVSTTFNVVAIMEPGPSMQITMSSAVDILEWPVIKVIIHLL